LSIFLAPDFESEIHISTSSRAKQSGVEGSPRDTQGFATGFLDFARNDKGDHL
jgi:hypothetical protein